MTIREIKIDKSRKRERERGRRERGSSGKSLQLMKGRKLAEGVNVKLRNVRGAKFGGNKKKKRNSGLVL